MFQELLAVVINLLIVDPLQDELDKRLADVRAPQAIMADVRTCAEAALPKLADRALADPAWAVTTVLNVWTGSAAPEDVLSTATSQCDAAVRSARAVIEARGA